MFCELTQTRHLHAQHSSLFFFFFLKHFKRFVFADDLQTNTSDPAECVCIHRTGSKRAFQLLHSVTLWDALRQRQDVLRYVEKYLCNPPTPHPHTTPTNLPPSPKTVGVWNNGLFARLAPHLCTVADRHTNAIGQLTLSMLTRLLETRLQLFCQCSDLNRWRG